MSMTLGPAYDPLFAGICEILDGARRAAGKAVNSIITVTYGRSDAALFTMRTSASNLSINWLMTLQVGLAEVLEDECFPDEAIWPTG
jgi:hypothetical protein